MRKGSPAGRIRASLLLAKPLSGYELISSLITRAACRSDKAATTFTATSCWMKMQDCLCLYVPELPVARCRMRKTEETRIAALAAMPPASPSFPRPHVGRLRIACRANDAQPSGRRGDRAPRQAASSQRRRAHDERARNPCWPDEAIRLNIPVAECARAAGQRRAPPARRVSLARNLQARVAGRKPAHRQMCTSNSARSHTPIRGKWCRKANPGVLPAANWPSRLNGVTRRASEPGIQATGKGLRLIMEMKYEAYFLPCTTREIRSARRRFFFQARPAQFHDVVHGKKVGLVLHLHMRRNPFPVALDGLAPAGNAISARLRPVGVGRTPGFRLPGTISSG